MHNNNCLVEAVTRIIFDFDLFADNVVESETIKWVQLIFVSIRRKKLL